MRTDIPSHLILLPALCLQRLPSHRSVRYQSYHGLLQQKYSLPSVSPSVIPERGLRLPLDRTR